MLTTSSPCQSILGRHFCVVESHLDAFPHGFSGFDSFGASHAISVSSASVEQAPAPRCGGKSAPPSTAWAYNGWAFADSATVGIGV